MIKLNEARKFRRGHSRILVICSCLLIVGAAAVRRAGSTDFPLDLDGVGGPESVIQMQASANPANGPFPNVVCVSLVNKVDGQSYVFEWPKAGPGGFAGQTPMGAASGAGIMWRWDTIGQLFPNPCVGDQCLVYSNAAGGSPSAPVPIPGLTTSICTGGTSAGEACVTHADCPSGGICGISVNVSDASLASSLLQFFSPAVELLHVESSFKPVAGGFLCKMTVTNVSPNTIGFEVADGGAFADIACGPNQVNCGDVCCDGTNCDLQLCGGLQCNPPDLICVPPAVLCGSSCINPDVDEQYCGVDSGCNGGSICNPSVCNGGMNDGINCTTDLDCPGAACTAVCSGGSLDSMPCTSDGECPGGTCDTPCCLGGACVACHAGTAGVVAPGDEIELCLASNHPAKEILTKVGVFCDGSDPEACALDENGVRGMVNMLVPDFDVTIPGDAPYLSVLDIELVDDAPGGNGDGMLQPDETVDLFVTLVNAGPVAVAPGSMATLSAERSCVLGPDHGVPCTGPGDCLPPGTCPPDITTVQAPYATGIGAGPMPGTTPPPADCSAPTVPLPSGVNQPASPFSVTIPPDQASNATRLFELSLAGQTARFTLGIRDAVPPSFESTGDTDPCGELFQPPIGVSVDPTLVRWSALDGASVLPLYDVAGGDLATLVSAGWPTANPSCLITNGSASFAKLEDFAGLFGGDPGASCSDNTAACGSDRDCTAPTCIGGANPGAVCTHSTDATTIECRGLCTTNEGPGTNPNYPPPTLSCSDTGLSCVTAGDCVPPATCEAFCNPSQDCAVPGYCLVDPDVICNPPTATVCQQLINNCVGAGDPYPCCSGAGTGNCGDTCIEADTCTDVSPGKCRGPSCDAEGFWFLVRDPISASPFGSTARDLAIPDCP